MNCKPQGPKYILPKKKITGSNEKTFLDYFETGFDSFILEHGHIESKESLNIDPKKNTSIISILKGKVKLNGIEFDKGSTALILAGNGVRVEEVSDENIDFYIGYSQ